MCKERVKQTWRLQVKEMLTGIEVVDIVSECKIYVGEEGISELHVSVTFV